MDYRNLHKWNITPKKAVELQYTLTKNVFSSWPRLGRIKKIAGVDVSFISDYSCAAICILSYPDLNLLEEKTVVMKTVFPYIPGLLTFREGPAVLKCFRKIKT